MCNSLLHPNIEVVHIEQYKKHFRQNDLKYSANTKKNNRHFVWLTHCDPDVFGTLERSKNSI